MSDEAYDLVDDAERGPALEIVGALPDWTELEAWYEPAFPEGGKCEAFIGVDGLTRFLDTYGVEEIEVAEFYAPGGEADRGMVMKGRGEVPYTGDTGRLEVWARVDRDAYDQALAEAGVV